MKEAYYNNYCFLTGQYIFNGIYSIVYCKVQENVNG